MEASFIRFLYNPDDPDYSYYTAESIRRYVALFKNKRDLPFLEYVLKTIPDKNILKHLYYLYPDSTFIKRAANHPVFRLYKGKGITYDQLYNYCIHSSMNSCTESYLSAALYYCGDTIRRDSLLQLYLSSSQIIRKEYALALLNNNLHDISGKQSILFFSRYQYKERMLNGEYTDYFASQEKYPVYLKLLTSMTQKYFPEKRIISIDSALTANPDEYFMFLETERTIEQLKYYHIQNIDLFKLDNRYWRFCKKIETQKLEFLSVKSWVNKRKFIESSLRYLFLWGVWFVKQISYTFTGPSKYYYEIDYKMLSINDKTLIDENNTKVKYKLRPPYFINSVYHVFKKKSSANN